MKRAHQTSESIELAAFLALSGGLMDAYSYLGRGGVFANAQTGNLLLLGISLSQGSFGRALAYAFPAVFFALGIVLAQVIRLDQSKQLDLPPAAHHIHWRQICLLVEILLLLVVAFIPSEFDMLANALTSLACGIQVQTFRKLHGRGFATTMCIGNLRSGTEALVAWIHTKNKQALESMLLYYGVICCFVLGAIMGNFILSFLGLYTIAISPVILSIACVMLLIDREKRAHGAGEKTARL